MGGATYRYFATALDLTAAEDKCAAQGAGWYLAKITSTAQNDAAAALVTDESWIGLQMEGGNRFTSGPLSYITGDYFFWDSSSDNQDTQLTTNELEFATSLLLGSYEASGTDEGVYIKPSTAASEAKRWEYLAQSAPVTKHVLCSVSEIMNANTRTCASAFIQLCCESWPP